MTRIAAILALAASALAAQESWTVSNPGGASRVELVGADVSVRCAPGEDLWSDVDLAPRALAAAPAGKWSVETEVLTGGGPGTFAGLFAFRDAANWLAWGVDGGRVLEASGVLDGAGHSRIAAADVLPRAIRLVRRGDRYQFQYRTGDAWETAGTFETAALGDEARLGLLARSSAGAAAFLTLFKGPRPGDAPPEVLAARAADSSSAYPGYEAAVVLTGVRGRAWCSAGGTTFPHWLDFEIPAGTRLAEIEFDPFVSDRANYPGIVARRIRICAVPEGGAPEDAEPLGEIELDDDREVQVFRFEEPVPLGRVRLEILSNHGDASWTELGQLRFLGE